MDNELAKRVTEPSLLARRWGVIAALSFIPWTALLHHALFFRPTCMLRYFGSEYSPSVVLTWLARDPSPYVAALLAAGLYVAGKRVAALRPWTLAFLIAFAPLSLWIWDIPFSGRAICKHMHDGKSGIRTRYLYVMGAVLWLFIGRRLARTRTRTDELPRRT
jgi:hypothetical protein